MGTVRVQVGTVDIDVETLRVHDSRQPVEFEGQELATFRSYAEHPRGGVVQDRGTDETLYKAADGRLIVHTQDWQKDQYTPITSEYLYEVNPMDLEPEGQFADLGRVAGYGKGTPLTLDEALAVWPAE
jgi:hypothetical protein